MTANERQVGGSHYQQSGAIQHWDYAASNDFDYFQGQITKYITRWRKKNGIADLEKAQHFLEKYIEVEKAKMNAPSETIVLSKKELKDLGYRELPPRIGQDRPFGFDPKEDCPNWAK
jgi:hypothetical protein